MLIALLLGLGLLGDLALRIRLGENAKEAGQGVGLVLADRLKQIVHGCLVLSVFISHLRNFLDSELSWTLIALLLLRQVLLYVLVLFTIRARVIGGCGFVSAQVLLGLGVRLRLKLGGSLLHLFCELGAQV